MVIAKNVLCVFFVLAQKKHKKAHEHKTSTEKAQTSTKLTQTNTKKSTKETQLKHSHYLNHNTTPTIRPSKMPRHRSRSYRYVDDSESSVSSSCKSECEDDTSSSGSGSDSNSSSSASEEESCEQHYSEKESDVESATRNQHNHYRENDSSSSDNESVSDSSVDDDSNNDEGNSDDENDSVKEADGTAKQLYLEEKRRGSVLKEKTKEHIPLLRAMAVGLKDDVRQDERFKSCVDNGFVKKKDVEMLKRHLYTSQEVQLVKISGDKKDKCVRISSPEHETCSFSCRPQQ